MNPTSISFILNPGSDAAGLGLASASAGAGQGPSFGEVLQGQGAAVRLEVGEGQSSPPPGGDAWTRLAAFAGERDPAALPGAGPLALAFAGPAPVSESEAPLPEALLPDAAGPAVQAELPWVQAGEPGPVATGPASPAPAVDELLAKAALSLPPEGGVPAAPPPPVPVSEAEPSEPAPEPVTALWSTLSTLPQAPAATATVTDVLAAGVPATTKPAPETLAPAVPSPVDPLAAGVRLSVAAPAAAITARFKASAESAADLTAAPAPPPTDLAEALTAPVAAPAATALAGPAAWLAQYPVTRPARPLEARLPAARLGAAVEPGLGKPAGESAATDRALDSSLDGLLAAADGILTETRAPARAEPAAAFSREPASPLAQPSLLPRADGLPTPGQPVPGQTPLQTALNLAQPGWGQALGQQVLWLVQNGPQRAELKVNPPHLGPLEVKLSLDKQQQASITFFAADGGVREALEAALPRLRELFDSQGLHLQQANVSDQSLARQQQGQADTGQQGAGPFGNLGAVRTDEDGAEPEAGRRVAVGLVDHYV